MSIRADTFPESESSTRQASENDDGLGNNDIDRTEWAGNEGTDGAGEGLDAWDYPDPSTVDSGSDGLVRENIEDEFERDDEDEDTDFVMEGGEDYEDEMYEFNVRNSVLDSRLVPITCHRESETRIAMRVPVV